MEQATARAEGMRFIMSTSDFGVRLCRGCTGVGAAVGIGTGYIAPETFDKQNCGARFGRRWDGWDGWDGWLARIRLTRVSELSEVLIKPYTGEDPNIFRLVKVEVPNERHGVEFQ